MRKLVLTALLALTTTGVMAQHHGYHGGHWVRHGWGWAPLIGGAVAGAVIYDIYNRPIVIQQPPVIVQQPVTITQGQNCSPWTETQNPDGTITRTRTCSQ